MFLGRYVDLQQKASRDLAEAYREIAEEHPGEADLGSLLPMFGRDLDGHVRDLAPFAERYDGSSTDEPERLHRDLFEGARSGALGLLRDLHDLLLMATECEITWTLLAQGAQGARDADLLDLAHEAGPQLTVQLAWLRTRMKAEAPQALVVAR